MIELDEGEENAFPTIVHEVEQQYDEDLHNRLFLNQNAETQPSQKQTYQIEDSLAQIKQNVQEISM